MLAALILKISKILIFTLLVIACTDQDREAARLASGCINASPDNRVKLSGSWSSNFEVETDGDDITVRTEVPMGIALNGKIRFGQREFRCREVNGRIEFVSATWRQPDR